MPIKAPNKKPADIIKPTPPLPPPPAKSKLCQLQSCLQDMLDERRRVNSVIAKLKMEIVIEERLQAVRRPAEEKVAA